MLKRILFSLFYLSCWRNSKSERAMETPCPGPDWTFSNYSDTCFYVEGRYDYSFFDAVKFCKMLDLPLAIPTTPEENNFLAEMLLTTGNFLIGLRQNTVKESLSRSDGKDLKTPLLWDNGFPKKTTGDQCVYLEVRTGRWRDASCYARKYKIACAKTGNSACTIKNGGCDQLCVNTGPNKRKCQCKVGFKMEGKKCIDIDECKFGNGGCQHVCHNIIGSYTCSCKSGKSLLYGRVCKDTTSRGMMTMEIVSLFITITFPGVCILGFFMVSIWQKNQQEEETKSMSEKGTEPKTESKAGSEKAPGTEEKIEEQRESLGNSTKHSDV